MTTDTFAFRLKELLEIRQLTLQSVATALNVSKPAVHKWTKGGEIDHDKLRKLAAHLSVNWIWLRYGESAEREGLAAEAVEVPMTDIRRRHTQDIMASEARMKLGQEAARIVTWEWNTITDGLVYSPNVETVYGWPIASNEDFWARIPPEDIASLKAIYEAARHDGVPVETDFRMLQADGGWRWISSRATAVRDYDGRIVRVVGISMDITQRKMAEGRLRDQQARIESVLEAVSEGVAILSADLRCETANAALARMLGHSVASLVGQDFSTLLADRGARLRRMLTGRPNARLSARLLHRDGSMVAVTIHALLKRAVDAAGAESRYFALALTPAAAPRPS